jgi:hypothetical protein
MGSVASHAMLSSFRPRLSASRCDHWPIEVASIHSRWHSKSPSGRPCHYQTPIDAPSSHETSPVAGNDVDDGKLTHLLALGVSNVPVGSAV